MLKNSAIDQNLNNWDVSAVTNMYRMFSGAEVFNQDISNWNVSAVTIMKRMFLYERVFNQDISNWDVSQVTDHAFFDDSASAWKNSAWKPKFQ